MKKLEKYWTYVVIAFAICMFIKPILCALILGILLLITAGSTLSFLWRMRHEGVNKVGWYHSFERDDDGHKIPIIEYVSDEGKMIQAKPAVYGSTDLSALSPVKHLIQKKVIIRVDPSDPEKFFISNEGPLNLLLGIILLLVGLAAITLTFCVLLGYIELGGTEKMQLPAGYHAQ